MQKAGKAGAAANGDDSQRLAAWDRRRSSSSYLESHERSSILIVMLKSTIFREYDIRGIADTELLSPGIEQLGKAIGTHIGSNTRAKRSMLAAMSG